MKKIICAALCALFILCAAACGNTEPAVPAETQSSDNNFVFNGVSIDLPEGFTVKQGAGVIMATYKDYPVHSDNITFTDGTDKVSDYTEESLKQEIGAVLGELKDFQMEKKKIDGCDLVVSSFGISYLGVDMTEKIYAIFIGEKSVTLTFVSVSGEFDAAFEQSAESIKIVK